MGTIPVELDSRLKHTLVVHVPLSITQHRSRALIVSAPDRADLGPYAYSRVSVVSDRAGAAHHRVNRATQPRDATACSPAQTPPAVPASVPRVLRRLAAGPSSERAATVTAQFRIRTGQREGLNRNEVYSECQKNNDNDNLYL